jgi:hypothetical protein
MTGRAALEVDTLTIRIPIRLQRRGGRKLSMTPEGVAAPARKPSRDETPIKALVRAVVSQFEIRGKVGPRPGSLNVPSGGARPSLM